MSLTNFESLIVKAKNLQDEINAQGFGKPKEIDVSEIKILIDNFEKPEFIIERLEELAPGITEEEPDGRPYWICLGIAMVVDELNKLM